MVFVEAPQLLVAHRPVLHKTRQQRLRRPPEHTVQQTLQRRRPRRLPLHQCVAELGVPEHRIHDVPHGVDVQDGHTDGHVAWFDAFDPATGEWTRLPDAPRPRDHFQAAIVDGRLLARTGATTTPEDLDRWSGEFFDYAHGSVTERKARKDLYLPQVSNLCASCGVRDFCRYVGGEKAGEVPAPWEEETA